MFPDTDSVNILLMILIGDSMSMSPSSKMVFDPVQRQSLSGRLLLPWVLRSFISRFSSTGTPKGHKQKVKVMAATSVGQSRVSPMFIFERPIVYLTRAYSYNSSLGLCHVHLIDRSSGLKWLFNTRFDWVRFN